MKVRAGLIVVLCLGIFSASADACAVCNGDPESPLTHGAQQGVIVMLAVTYTLLIGLGGMFFFIMTRARRRVAALALAEKCLTGSPRARVENANGLSASTS